MTLGYMAADKVLAARVKDSPTGSMGWLRKSPEDLPVAHPKIR
jgi:hypothetical protein